MGELSIQKSLTGKDILLTGASGFLGKVWLGLILSRVPDVKRIRVLLRKKSGKSAHQRVEDLLNDSPVFQGLHEAYGDGLDDFLSDRIEALDGDVGEPDFGLSEAALSCLGDVDLIVNVAGLVEFHADLRSSFRTNVQGALHALELARKIGCPLLHVSTAFVAGSRDGLVPEETARDFAPSRDDFDAEADYRELLTLVSGKSSPAFSWTEEGRKRANERGWPNAYSYSKSLAESLLFGRAAGRAGKVPVSVFRPAIVESAQSFPFPGWNEGITTCAPLSYLLSRWTRVLRVETSHTLDLVPVDTVCEGLTVAAAALLQGQAKPVYHCGTSDRNPLNLRFAIEMMGMSQRRRRRNDGTRTLEKKILSRTAPHFVGEGSFFTAERLRRAATLLLEAADLGAGYVPAAAKPIFEYGRRAVRKARWDLIKAEKILDSFEPYLSRYNYRFATKNLADHAVAEPEFRFRPETISWSRYIADVHEPGLWKWCYPLMEGKPVEVHRPARRCRLRSAEAEMTEHSPIMGGKYDIQASAKGP